MEEFETEEEAITGINVTPLVDITLVLLIIFMVTARFISEPSIGVALPKSSVGGRAEIKEDNVFLSINDRHEIFLNNMQVRKEDVGQKIQALKKENPNLNLILRADKTIPHGEVIALLDVVRQQGITQFGIAIEGTSK